MYTGKITTLICFLSVFDFLPVDLRPYFNIGLTAMNPELYAPSNPGYSLCLANTYGLAAGMATDLVCEK